MSIGLDFSPLARTMLNNPSMVIILESYDHHFQAKVDASTAAFRGQKFSLLVLAEYFVQCKEAGVIHRDEAATPDWARNNFARSPFCRIAAIDSIFSKLLIDPRGKDLVMQSQIRELRRDLGSRIVETIPGESFETAEHLTLSSVFLQNLYSLNH